MPFGADTRPWRTWCAVTGNHADAVYDTNRCRRVVLPAEVITVPQDIDIEVTDDNEEVRISIKAGSRKAEFRTWLTPEDARQVGAVLMKIADRIEGHS